MKSKIREILRSIGKKKINYDLSAYKDFHQDTSCDGEFTIKLKKHYKYFGLTCGPFEFASIPMIECSKCKSGFIPKELISHIEKSIALNLLVTDGLWSKNQIKFLREFFSKTQSEIAEILGIADRYEMSKKESNRFPHINLSKSDQFLLRSYYINLAMKKFEISSKTKSEIIVEVIKLAEKTNKSKEKVEISHSFIPSLSDFKKLFPRSVFSR